VYFFIFFLLLLPFTANKDVYIKYFLLLFQSLAKLRRSCLTNDGRWRMLNRSMLLWIPQNHQLAALRQRCAISKNIPIHF